MTSCIKNTEYKKYLWSVLIKCAYKTVHIKLWWQKCDDKNVPTNYAQSYGDKNVHKSFYVYIM